MQKASLLWEYDDVIQWLQKIAVKKGYVVESADCVEGIIKAHKKHDLFSRVKKLDIKVQKIDLQITNIELMVNNNEKPYDTPSSPDEIEEQNLISTIYKHF